jgi:6-pyruvoyltetrahydropterin/6-carboxytetrahydropterin synthase
MFHTGVRRRLTARHFLVGDFGPETTPHAHPYDIEWVCGVAELDGAGFGVDIALMERILEDVLREIDDRLLNDLDYFQDRQPSLENLAVFLELRLRAELESAVSELSLQSSSVQIWESDTAWARYSFRR